MPNIRIDLSIPVYDGQPLTFKSPTDCSEVTGLIIYYPSGDTTVSKVFQFTDAHGNNVGSVNLFASDVLVKVILDTEALRAYVQNADTNAYLEGKFALTEYMYVHNDFFAPICTDDGTSSAILDDDGNVIVADWFFQTEPATEEIEDPTTILVDKVTGCLYRIFGGKVEWFNPPMQLGVEYRTTERYLDKPVYVKLLDGGVAPNAGTKDVSIGESNIDEAFIDFSKSSIKSGKTNILPAVSDIKQILIFNGAVRVETTNDRSGYTMKICVKYTKTTD